MPTKRKQRRKIWPANSHDGRAPPPSAFRVCCYWVKFSSIYERRDRQMPEFPKTRPFVTGRNTRRQLSDGPSLTEILVLDDSGIQRTQYGPGGHYAVYFWTLSNEWKLEAVYNSRDAARGAAARVRQELN